LLTSVILTIQEAEIRRIVVQSQPWATSLQDPVLKKNPSQKSGRGVGETQGICPKFKTQYHYLYINIYI
jgi:hypothetical protein